MSIKAKSQHANHAELKKIYLSTNGNGWTNNSGWKTGINNPNASPCTWYGVYCEGNLVKGISLPNNNLTGTLPESITVPSLRYLRLAGNHIGGKLPSINSKLEELNLSENDLIGPIPESYSTFNFSKTTNFNFTGNDLSGCFPIFIKPLSTNKFDTKNNPKMPFLGDHSNVFINNKPEKGSACNDGISGNEPDRINMDCSCNEAVPCNDTIIFRTYYVCFGDQIKFHMNDYAAGTYPNQIVPGNNSCDSIFNLTIINYPEIKVDLGPDKDICKNSPTQIGIAQFISQYGETYSYSWSNGNNNSYQTVNLSTSSPYTLTVKNNLNCSAWDQINLSVVLRINAYIDTSICLGELYKFKDEDYPVGYHEYPFVNPGGCDTFYKITVLQRQDINVLQTLNIDCKSNQVINLRDRLEYEPSGGLWKEVSVLPSTGGFNASSGTFNPFNQKPGLYTFSYEMKAGTYCGSSIRSVNIRVTECDGTTDCKINHNPDSIKAKIGNNDYNVLKNDEITVSDLELKILNYDNSILSNVSINNLGDLAFTISDTLLQPTSITYASTSIECSINKEGSLKVLVANSVDINVTNIITPNNDGLNDVLRFNSQQIIKESELWIYNRWGSRIYHTKDYKNDWSGERFPGGTYYYVLKINDATYKSALTVDK